MIQDDYSTGDPQMLISLHTIHEHFTGLTHDGSMEEAGSLAKGHLDPAL